MAQGHSDWVLGFAAAVWWSRLAPPALPAWADGKPLRLHERTCPKDAPEPKAYAGDEMLRPDTPAVRVRCGDGRPGSHVPTALLQGGCEPLTAEGKKALVWVWDHARWPRRQEGCRWIGAHNRPAKASGGMRIIVCPRPIKSPWLNRLEPPWVHAKRAIVEPHRLLSKTELVDRSCCYFHGKYAEHLQQVVAKKVA